MAYQNRSRVSGYSRTRMGGGRLVGRWMGGGRLGASSLATAAGAAAGTAVLPGVGTAVGGLLGSLVGGAIGGGAPDGSSQDPRIIDLNNAYNQAIQGLNGPGQGVNYINTWINDQPPHPTYSNQYAQQLLALIQQAAATGQGLSPATSNTSPSSPPSLGAATSSGLSGTIAGLPTWAWLVALGGGAFLLTRKKS
jgi:hypothetical protein